MCVNFTIEAKERLEKERKMYEGVLALKDFIIEVPLSHIEALERFDASTMRLMILYRYPLKPYFQTVSEASYHLGRVYLDDSEDMIQNLSFEQYQTGYHAVVTNEIHEVLLFNPLRERLRLPYYMSTNVATYVVRLPVILSEITAIEGDVKARSFGREVVGRMMLIMDETDWAKYKAYHLLSKTIDIVSGALVGYAEELAMKEIEQANETQVPAGPSLSQSSVSRV